MKCHSCGAENSLPFVDLAHAPYSNAYLSEEELAQSEVHYPLSVVVCQSCWLVQVTSFQPPNELFSEDYAYYSSFSTSWLAHSKAYTEAMIERLPLTAASKVLEVASNDGYLLQYFVEAGIPALGVEPTAGTAARAREKGVETLEVFWGTESARAIAAEHGPFDLLLGNNVLAHVPDIGDFIGGFAAALTPGGTVTFEFPHLLNLIRHNQFDTIYHEHFSYLSLTAVKTLLEKHELCVYDVEELPTHGGSLRVFARRMGSPTPQITERVARLLQKELDAGLQSPEGYRGLQREADEIRATFLEFLYEQRRAGRRVAAYGAAAKGNTLLNYCGIKGTELIEFVVDRNVHKQGKFLPGSHIPIVGEDRLREAEPDFVVVFPWNIWTELREQLDYIRNWDGRLVTCVPSLQLH